jgi:hypothetical protein
MAHKKYFKILVKSRETRRSKINYRNSTYKKMVLKEKERLD